jgi:ketosteroid isomerase-like protein
MPEATKLSGSPSLADRAAINDLLVRYCHTIDDKDWAAFASLFTADAIVDFTAFGGPRCGVPGLVEFLRGVALQVHGWQHTISTVLLTADGDVVHSRAAAQAMMITHGDDSFDRVVFSGLWYRDRLVCTDQGWKISERVQQRSWMHAVTPTA